LVLVAQVQRTVVRERLVALLFFLRSALLAVTVVFKQVELLEVLERLTQVAPVVLKQQQVVQEQITALLVLLFNAVAVVVAVDRVVLAVLAVQAVAVRVVRLVQHQQELLEQLTRVAVAVVRQAVEQARTSVVQAVQAL
jgi:hypothetical protein